MPGNMEFHMASSSVMFSKEATTKGSSWTSARYLRQYKLNFMNFRKKIRDKS